MARQPRSAVTAANTANAPIAKKREAIPNPPDLSSMQLCFRPSASRKSLAAREIDFRSRKRMVRPLLCGGSFEFAGARQPKAHPDDHERDDGDGERRQHVDLRAHAEPYLREHHHRQRAAARAGGEARDHQIVPRQRECQQPTRQNGGENDGQRDDEEHLERAARPDPWRPPRERCRRSPFATAPPP